MRYLITLCLMLCFSLAAMAQEEFIVGKSANTFNKGGAVVSAEYTVSAFDNFRIRRVGLDLAYGFTDRLTVTARGSASDFPTGSIDFETGNITAIYQLGKKSDSLKRWAIAPFLQASVVSRTALVPSDINLDTHSAGYSGGLIITRNTKELTLSGSLAYARLTVPRLIDGVLDGAALLYHLSANKMSDLRFEKNRYQVGILGELVGQVNEAFSQDNLDLFGAGSYLDLLGGLQFTANNTYRVELAVQTEVFGNVPRFSEGLYHIRLKYLMW